MSNPEVTPTLFIVRGLSGSGKSSLARRLAPAANAAADDFFEQNGGYEFSFEMLPTAHQWCQEKIAEYMAIGHFTIAVHNTFSRPWEVKAYLELAEQHGYSVFIIEAQNEFGNVHNVPQATIERMRDRWEPLIGEKVGIRRQLRHRFNEARFRLLRKLPWRR
jgi:predicted kinase